MGAEVEQLKQTLESQKLLSESKENSNSITIKSLHEQLSNREKQIADINSDNEKL